MKYILTLLLAIILCQTTQAQMTTRVVRDSLFIPWEMVYGADNHIWFTQKNGYICRMEPVSGHIDTLYHETNTVIQSEGGMLGLALHPDFANNPYVYVAYNYSSGGYKERIVRYTYSNNSLGSPMTLLDNIGAANFHNGCRMIIVNNHLYITTGDATNTSTSQNTSSINGKTLRINLDGTIPTDNPISGSPVWSWGHRNAQGLVYANNKMYSSEHGPSSDDEVNIIEKARNYGWPDVRGFCNTTAEMQFCNDSNVVEPLMAWTPTLAVSGIDYYDHPMFPQLKNSLLMATLKNKELYQLQLNTAHDSITSATVISQVNFGRLRAICISPTGRIYISTSNSPASGTGAFEDQIIELYDPSFNNIRSINSYPFEINLYPNPSRDYITLQSNKSELKYHIYNLFGQIILEGIIERGRKEINIELLPDGMYLVDVADGNGNRKKISFLKQ